MKKLISIILLVMIIVFTASAQQHVESIMQNENYQLNGGMRASIGGRSRTVIPIQIPQGCIQIVYSVVAQRTSDATQDINLALQLTDLLGSYASVLSAAGHVRLPRGTETVDAFILSRPNYSSYFEAKQDNVWSYLRDYSRQACQSCTVTIPVNGISGGTLYLGLRNPSEIDGVNITLDVVAIYPH